MSHRQAQVEATLQRAIATVLSQRLSDPRIEGLVSVTRVDVSPDLHDAYIYVSVMPDRYERKTIGGLEHAAGYIRSLVGEAVRMRQIPRLEFRLDESIKKQARLFDDIQAGRDRDSAVETDADEKETDA